MHRTWEQNRVPGFTARQSYPPLYCNSTLSTPNPSDHAESDILIQYSTANNGVVTNYLMLCTIKNKNAAVQNHRKVVCCATGCTHTYLSASALRRAVLNSWFRFSVASSRSRSHRSFAFVKLSCPLRKASSFSCTQSTLHSYSLVFQSSISEASRWGCSIVEELERRCIGAD